MEGVSMDVMELVQKYEVMVRQSEKIVEVCEEQETGKMITVYECTFGSVE